MCKNFSTLKSRVLDFVEVHREGGHPKMREAASLMYEIIEKRAHPVKVRSVRVKSGAKRPSKRDRR
jgi:hypothetical protein